MTSLRSWLMILRTGATMAVMSMNFEYGSEIEPPVQHELNRPGKQH
jgi:hypothetical protein